MPNPFKNLLVEEVEPTYEESTSSTNRFLNGFGI